MDLSTIRPGMWVTHADGRIGILNDFNATAEPRMAPFMVNTAGGLLIAETPQPFTGEFHEVDAEGVTVRQELVSLDDIAQARWREIPEARRPERAVALKLGYAV